MPQMLHRLEHILETDIQGRKAESHYIRCAKIPDQAPFDQGLHQRVAMLKAQTDLAAIALPLVITDYPDIEIRTLLFDQGNKQLA